MTPKLIEEAINRGVAYLMDHQNPTGAWGTGKGDKVGPEGGWVTGYTSLVGLALIECGVSKEDPKVKRAASVVRLAAPALDSTYEVALAILFLDRLGDPRDKAAIQTLAVRLIVGQTASGGWAYKVPIPLKTESDKVLNALRRMGPLAPTGTVAVNFRDRPSSLGLCIKMSDDIRPKPPAKAPVSPGTDDPEKAKEAALKAAGSFRVLPVFQEPKLPEADPKERGSEPYNGTSDNSNTHFAIIGLWAARKYDVPTDRSFVLLSKRFRTSQGGAGGWDYNYARGGAGGASAMTCVALLGLAIGHALAIDKEAGQRPEQDPVVLNAFKMLSARVGAPTGRVDNRPTVKEAGGLYYLWALERIAVLYDVRTLDNKDWYMWGAEILVGHQDADGSWKKEKDVGYHGEDDILNTAFAVLFLRRANLTPDLSKRLISDSSALTASVSTPAPAPAPTPPPPVVTPPPAPVTPPPVVVAPTPAPQPVVQPRAPEPTPVVAEKPSGNGLWLIILIVAIVMLLACMIGGFFILKSKKDDKPKKGAAKKRGGDEDEDEDDDEEEEEEKPKKKVKRKTGAAKRTGKK